MDAPRPGAALEWRRAFAEEEVRAFARLSGDRGRHHLERDASGRLMVHGLLTATLPTKLGGDLNFIARAMEFEFLRPVYADEELRCRAVVESVERRRGSLAAAFSFEVTNPKGKPVLKGRTSGIIRRERGGRPAPSGSATPADAGPLPRERFLADAPAARAALAREVAELLSLLDGFSADEKDVLAHLAAHAGYGQDGFLRAPSAAALFGDEPSYLPPLSLPAGRARLALLVLVRRGVLRLEAAAEGASGALLLDHAALRAAAAPSAPRLDSPDDDLA